MTILFDIFVLLDGLEDEMNLEDKAIFGEIIKHFETRLNTLKEQMEEEEQRDNPPCCVMIHILPPQEQWALPSDQQLQKIRVSSKGYSPNLVKKIDKSFNDNDFILLNERLQIIAERFRN